VDILNVNNYKKCEIEEEESCLNSLLLGPTNASS
jgi:hypothetical protein